MAGFAECYQEVIIQGGAWAGRSLLDYEIKFGPSYKLRLMKIGKIAFLISVCPFIATPQTNSWQVVRDKANACKVSIPPNWKPSDIPGRANSEADKADLSISLRAGKTMKPMSEGVQKGSYVEKMIQNTSELIIYTSSLRPDTSVSEYHILGPGKGGVCSVILSASKSLTEDQVKKIAATVGPN